MKVWIRAAYSVYKIQKDAEEISNILISNLESHFYIHFVAEVCTSRQPESDHHLVVNKYVVVAKIENPNHPVLQNVTKCCIVNLKHPIAITGQSPHYMAQTTSRNHGKIRKFFKV